MPKIQKNVVLPTSDAGKVTQKQPINATHITTQCFLRPAPIAAIELFPNRKIDLSVNSFLRLNAMPRPVLSRAKVYNRAFFVPYRTVYKDFTKLVTSTPVPSLSTNLEVPSNVPFISNKAIVHFLMDHSLATTGAFDFKVVGSLESSYPDGAYKMGDIGAYAYKLLRSLGYNPVFNVTQDFYVSALPLLCYIKTILDWYYPSEYAYSDLFSYFDALFESQSLNQGIPTTFWPQFEQFCQSIAYCKFEPDYLVSAWDSPVGPNYTQFETQITIPDPTTPVLGNTAKPQVTNTGANATSNNGTPIVINSDTSLSANPMRQFSQFTLDALRSLTDYTKRHQLVGVRALDRYLADFGINLQAELLKRSYYIGANSFELPFYDVTCHADSDGANLGEQAGKSFANGSNSFNFSADEFGMFIVINSVIPVMTTYQGTNRHVFHINPLDFYRGDFDHLGVQAIRKCEAYVPKNGAAAVNGNGNDLATQVWGFIPRYAEYQVIPDLVTGRFELASNNSDLLGYFQGRNMERFDDVAIADFKHNLDFVLPVDYKNYNNIFYSTKTIDQINCSHYFICQFTDSSRAIWDTYDFENTFKAVKENIGGSTVN